MRIILLGAPGVGKGTQAKFIINRYRIPHISAGDILRIEMKSKSKIGLYIQNRMNHGELVEDEIVSKLIISRITKEDCMHGFLLDGFPRTVHQAYAMEYAKITIDCVIELICSDEEILERIMGRRIHAQSGRIYHIKYKPSKIDGKDDLTGEDLIIRNDDQEDIIHKRLIQYHHFTTPLINYYAKKAKIGHIKFHQVNTNCSVIEVNKTLDKILMEM